MATCRLLGQFTQGGYGIQGLEVPPYHKVELSFRHIPVMLSYYMELFSAPLQINGLLIESIAIQIWFAPFCNRIWGLGEHSHIALEYSICSRLKYVLILTEETSPVVPRKYLVLPYIGVPRIQDWLAFMYALICDPADLGILMIVNPRPWLISTGCFSLYALRTRLI